MLRAHVVYATITGNNRELADIVTQQLTKRGVTVTETEISQTDAQALTAADILVVCAYTYNEGHLPEEGLDFYEDLPGVDLHGKTYGVAGSGDTLYGDFYNTTVDRFDAAFHQTGAIKGAANVKIDLEPSTFNFFLIALLNYFNTAWFKIQNTSTVLVLLAPTLSIRTTGK